MSAEPSRTIAYSDDIRWRVVWRRIGLEMTFKDIAFHLQIAPSTAHRIFTLFQLTGSVEPMMSHQHYRKIDDHHELLILALVAENPCLYLHEICTLIEEATGLNVSGSTVCRVLHKMGFTRKKVQTIAMQRSSTYRGHFMSLVLQFSPECFVWVDETGSDARSHIRKFGYQLRGLTPVHHRILVRRKRISAISAISTDGIMGLHLTQGNVNSEIFCDFLTSLIPEMEAFDGSLKKSIIIMDNCSIHHTYAVQSLLQSVGILIFYLPPYSPDLNPIEEAFSAVKYYLKDHDELLQLVSDPIPIIKSAFQSTITANKCKKWILHSGYTD